ncbi:MAG: hypothetical protein ACK452_16680 [Bacteroidota bacterium]|jgi:hypothetical protein
MKTKWEILMERLRERFGNEPEIADILFLIGVQELGKFDKKFKKDEKVNLIHIAICTLLTTYGYYTFEGRDADGWPHWKLNEELPPLDAKQQNRLINEAVIDYFQNNGFIE